MDITPFIRTPFTDIFGHFNSFQQHPLCAGHEMRVVDCLEAYGIPRGKEKCRILMSDFRECVYKAKQNARNDIMRAERHRQYKAGERKIRYAEDVVPDSY